MATIPELPKIVLCPTCGAKNQAHWIFCWVCNLPLIERGQEQAVRLAAGEDITV